MFAFRDEVAESGSLRVSCLRRSHIYQDFKIGVTKSFSLALIDYAHDRCTSAGNAIKTNLRRSMIMSHRSALGIVVLSFAVLGIALLPNDAAGWGRTVTTGPTESDEDAAPTGGTESHLSAFVNALGGFPEKEMSVECSEVDLTTPCPSSGLGAGIEVNGTVLFIEQCTRGNCDPKVEHSTIESQDGGFSAFRAGGKVTVSGSEHNDGVYTVVSVSDARLEVAEDVTEEDPVTATVSSNTVQLRLKGNCNALYFNNDYGEDPDPDFDQISECEADIVYDNVFRSCDDTDTACTYTATNADHQFGYLKILDPDALEACSSQNFTNCTLFFSNTTTQGQDGDCYPETDSLNADQTVLLTANDQTGIGRLDARGISSQLVDVAASLDAEGEITFVCPKKAVAKHQAFAQPVAVNEDCVVDVSPETLKIGPGGSSNISATFFDAEGCAIAEINQDTVTLEDVLRDSCGAIVDAEPDYFTCNFSRLDVVDNLYARLGNMPFTDGETEFLEAEGKFTGANAGAFKATDDVRIECQSNEPTCAPSSE
jgi:hypothetical protein